MEDVKFTVIKTRVSIAILQGKCVFAASQTQLITHAHCCIWNCTHIEIRIAENFRIRIFLLSLSTHCNNVHSQ